MLSSWDFDFESKYHLSPYPGNFKEVDGTARGISDIQLACDLQQSSQNFQADHLNDLIRQICWFESDQHLLLSHFIFGLSMEQPQPISRQACSARILCQLVVDFLDVFQLFDGSFWEKLPYFWLAVQNSLFHFSSSSLSFHFFSIWSRRSLMTSFNLIRST